MTSAIEMRGITKRFGALVANNGIDLSVNPGEVLALLGENGAGKSTLMKILYGLYRPDAGQIFVSGQPVTLRSPADAIANGIGMVTQHFALVPTLNVAENVVLGAGTGVLFDGAAAEREVLETAQRYRLNVNPVALVRSLSVGEQQRVEILKALHRHARVLILDEPTAVLTPQEATALFTELKQMVAQGLSIIFISHHLDEVLAVSDHIMVLRNGAVAGHIQTKAANVNTLAKMMIGSVSPPPRASDGTERGREARTPTPPIRWDRTGEGAPSAVRGGGILVLTNIHALNNRKLPALRGISLAVNAGEVLGIAGVSGNGQTELAEVIGGMRRITQGQITLGGETIANLNAAQATAAGIGRIPEDRKTGVVGALSVAENLALEDLNEFTRSGNLDKQKMKHNAERMIAEYAIKATPSSPAGKLSGGNMQKVILARVLALNPKLIVAAQPTRGLDVGATDYVRNKLLAQRTRGAVILLISDDLDEILALSDRVAVMFEGRIMGVLNAREATAEQLGLLMAGKSIMPPAG